ncbi:hypothetical protein LTS14_010668 [Recurvomyces mirabilis]|uniref:uncharacterized protein n=1 Tax=Recurvomyces mirabilis TaxID=574656 RepID=UPI002DE1AC9F|nr:hypothetical protein LTS14_010668 [Recurvomyces mirabilis]
MGSPPEYIRRRNSTMFIGQPPFGFEGTDDCPGDTYVNFLPPRTPPPEMLYHERGHTPYADCTSSSAVPQHAWPSRTDLKPVDTVPTLFSSPHVVSRRRTSGDGTDMPNISRLNLGGVSDATYTDVDAMGRGLDGSNMKADLGYSPLRLQTELELRKIESQTSVTGECTPPVPEEQLYRRQTVNMKYIDARHGAPATPLPIDLNLRRAPVQIAFLGAHGDFRVQRVD